MMKYSESIKLLKIIIIFFIDPLFFPWMRRLLRFFICLLISVYLKYFIVLNTVLQGVSTLIYFFDIIVLRRVFLIYQYSVSVSCQLLILAITWQRVFLILLQSVFKSKILGALMQLSRLLAAFLRPAL